MAPELEKSTLARVKEGQRIFRYDTFGDEDFWGNTLKLHQAIAGEKLGGVGPGVSPKTALSVGLKVDAQALPRDLATGLKEGKINLDDPAATLALLKNNAVVGLTGFFDEQGQLTSMGIQCSLCHSTVDDSIAPGIGRRLDGWANRDLNVGAIIGLSPNLKAIADRLGIDVATVKKVLASWGPGKFDAELLQDGKGFRPDGKAAATLLPPAFGLAGINLHTWTGWGSVPYWNAYVANTQMRGKGTFYDPRLNNPEKYPIAVKTKDWNIRNNPDLITSKLPDLHLYQLVLTAPKPPTGSYDREAARRGEALFNGKATCASCHVPPLYNEPGWAMHTPGEMGIDGFQAYRSPTNRYRTAPLAGLWTHQKGGFYHDGRFATLLDVVNHYNALFRLKLTDQEKNDLVEFLKSI
ncbi:hypothetical protein DCMF_13955 [Candidatus Formimonas warabiya]|uniref:Cytochrome c domain-containing protein n=1 Tax=Formimonas warabiya TaxID=1761012 RepID=A0A3G1L1S8_FORW1|nr:hypothetical protein DCMF_13955 [Candidatus Formimonas warabiya]